ncbi:hypothetical protein [uncultured Draconibacterium sp.]|uniref:hypothetical protein n=1 Tax=uncultured Draconibacterium sp. TaxID=1573823 RepID=UPI0032166D98
MNTIDDLAEKAIKKIKESITDEVFLIIQNDKQLMHEYLRLVQEKGLNVVNMRIGKGVKSAFSLTNDDYRNDDPKSTLIQSHQILK